MIFLICLIWIYFAHGRLSPRKDPFYELVLSKVLNRFQAKHSDSLLARMIFASFFVVPHFLTPILPDTKPLLGHSNASVDYNNSSSSSNNPNYNNS